MRVSFFCAFFTSPAQTFAPSLRHGRKDLGLFDARRPIVRAVQEESASMVDLLMVALIGVLFLAAWGLAAFCEKLSGRGRS